MGSHLASHAQAGQRELEAAGGLPSRATGRQLATAVGQHWRSVPLAWRLAGTCALGAAAAAGVGYAASRNPSASPPGSAVELRVLVITVLLAAGIYAQTSRIQARMGGLLIGTGFFSALWLLNGSSNRLLFSVGVVVAGPIPLVFDYLMLAHPTGHLRSRTEERFLWLTGGVLAMLWLLAVAMTVQPPLKTPLLQCDPRCPANVFSLGSAPEAVGVVTAAMKAAWIALAGGTVFFLVRRARGCSEPIRRAMTPVTVVASANALFFLMYSGSSAAGFGLAKPAGALYAATTVAIPLAILAGLWRERLFMGQALAALVSQLVQLPQADPEALMAAALRDPSLRIVYQRPGLNSYVDSHGRAVTDPPADQTSARIERNGRPAAVITYNPDLADQARFVQAAGAAALIRLDRARLQAELGASNADLTASRGRLMEMAHAERRRIERDLHDGVQQHLVGLRIRLQLAVDALETDPTEGQRVLALVGNQLDDVLHEIRSLARGIYPSLLTERGLREALKAAARAAPIDVELLVGRIERYPEDVEVAVYFCCLEALQNVAKHAGAGVTTTIRVWEDPKGLQFEVRDNGVGFNPVGVRDGHGLINMRDRIEAIGGTIAVTSQRGRGTRVRASVPVT